MPIGKEETTVENICLYVEYYAEGVLTYAEMHDDAVMDDEFVYTDSFKVKKTDTSIMSTTSRSNSVNPKRRECVEERRIVVDDAIGTSDSRFIAI